MSKHFRLDVRALPRRTLASLAATCMAMILAALAGVWALAGCDDDTPTVEEYIAKSGIAGRDRLRIGVYADQPVVGGYSRKANPQRADDFELGFETELAIKLAAFLGFPPGSIRFVPVATEDRERLLVDDPKVDVMIASYSITQQRKDKGVAFVGPYLITQPEVLVRRGFKAKARSFVDLDMLGRRLCTEDGSTSAIALRERNVTGFTGLRTAKDCIVGMLADHSDPSSFDAFMIDETILAGYEREHPGKFERVNLALEQTEKLGIGVSSRDTHLTDLVANFLLRSYEAKEAGAWQQAWKITLGTMLGERAQPPMTEPADFTRLRDTSDRIQVGLGLYGHAWLFGQQATHPQRNVRCQ